MLKIFLYPLIVVMACGIAASIGVHLTALAGGTVSRSWANSLHEGVVLLSIPSVLVSMEVTRQVRREDFWEAALAGCPAWMHRALRYLVGYSLLAFLVFSVVSLGGPVRIGVAEWTPSTLAFFSSVWMLGYAIHFAVLYSRVRLP